MSNRRIIRKVAASYSIGLLFSTLPVYAFTDDSTNNQSNARKYKEGEVIVKYKSGRNAENLGQTRFKYNLKETRNLDKSSIKLLTYDEKSSMDQVIKDLMASGQVEYAEPNYVRKPAVVTDPLYGLQWGFKNTGQTIGYTQGTPRMDMGTEYAWSMTKGNSSVVVGVIDTGIDINHPDLKNQIWKNPGEIANDGIDNDHNGYIDDVNGWDFVNDNKTVFDSADEDDHGTHVAGTIAATNNTIGVVGVAPNVKIMPLKFLGMDGGSIADEIEAIAYAKAKGVKIINMSLGGYGYSQAEYDAIQNTNALFITAAGNEGNNNDGDDPHYPSSYDLSNIISVAAMDNNGFIPYWSNFGANTVDLVAPGVNIVSTVPGENGDYTYAYAAFSGTSMATPHVTGTAALLLSKYTSFSPSTLKDCILYTTSYLPDAVGLVGTWGMLSAGRALYLDITDPVAPNVNEITDQNNSVSGQAEADSTVMAKVGTTIIGQRTATAEGTFSIPIPMQSAGTEVTISATDKAGNLSEATMIVVKDITAPAAPIVNDVTEQSEAVSGRAEARSTVIIQTESTILGQSTATTDGTFSIPIPLQIVGTTLTVTSIDKAGNISQETKVVVKDITAPAAPIVNDVTNQSNSVNGMAETNSTVIIKVGTTKIGQGTTPTEGTFSIPIPVQKAGTALTITAIDNFGNISQATKVVVKDITAPAAPIVNDVTEQSEAVSGRAEAGSTVIIQTESTILGQSTATADGTFSIPIPLQMVGTALTVTSTDQAGNISQETKVVVIKDVTAPTAPIVNKITDQSNSVSGLVEARFLR